MTHIYKNKSMGPQHLNVTEKNYVQKKPHANKHKAQIAASGWNGIARKVIANKIMIWRFLKHEMCYSFEIDSRLG